MSKQPTGNNEQQPKLVDTPPQPEVPRLVQLGFSIVNFTKPYLDRDKDDNPTIGFDLNLKLVPELREWLPKRIAELWEGVEEYTMKNGSIDEGVIVNCKLAQAPDVSVLELTGAEVVNTAITIVEEKGTGETREVTRLKCRIVTSLTDDAWRFTRLMFDRPIWLKWGEAQGRLIH